MKPVCLTPSFSSKILCTRRQWGTATEFYEKINITLEYAKLSPCIGISKGIFKYIDITQVYVPIAKPTHQHSSLNTIL